MKAFQRILFLCVLGTFLVILAGAIVRGTGSGLGCPDWPRCFGQWVPPMDVSELPENYKEIYKISGKVIADFDPFKTWTEYINRLLGVVLGFLVILLFGQSFKLRHIDRNFPWYAGGLLILILIQGGVGAFVVSTHLKPFIITIHMFLAVLLLFGLMFLGKYCHDLEDSSIQQPIDTKALRLSKILVYLVFFQVLLGTQVRQQVDHLLRDTMEATRSTLIDHLGPLFLTHRSFSLVIIVLMIALLMHLHRSRYNRSAFGLTFLALISTGGNVATGIILNYFNFPKEAQPLHLFFGIVTLGFLYRLFLNLKGSLLED